MTWRPIETAPDEPALVFFPNDWGGLECGVVQVYETPATSIGLRKRGGLECPTHWMPLPAIPSAQSQAPEPKLPEGFDDFARSLIPNTRQEAVAAEPPRRDFSFAATTIEDLTERETIAWNHGYETACRAMKDWPRPSAPQAAALLEVELPPLPEPSIYAYAWNGPFGRHTSFNASHYNGRACDEQVLLYSREQIQEYGRACIAAARAAGREHG